MMNSPAARLTAREIIAKTFSAKSRRGYDPAEVDAYLMDVARQVDELNLEIDRLTNEVVRLSFGQSPTSAPAPAPAPVAMETPPPPPPPPVAAPIASAPAAGISAASASAEEESLKLILRAAQKTAEQTITDARTRAEEILSEARYRASEITRESDRKAFEAASRVQGELVQLDEQLNQKRSELDGLARTVDVEKGRVRQFATDLLRTIGEDAPAPVGAAAASRPLPPPPVQLDPPPAPSEAVVLDLTNDEEPAPAKQGGGGGFRNDFDSFSPFGTDS